MRKTKLRKYLVSVKEVHTQGYMIEAKNKEDAIQRVADGSGELIEKYFEYSHTLDPDTWGIEEVAEGNENG